MNLFPCFPLSVFSKHLLVTNSSKASYKDNPSDEGKPNKYERTLQKNEATHKSS